MWNKEFMDVLWTADVDMSMFVFGITLQGYRGRNELNSL